MDGLYRSECYATLLILEGLVKVNNQ